MNIFTPLASLIMSRYIRRNISVPLHEAQPIAPEAKPRIEPGRFYTLISGSYTWISSRDKENIARLKEVLREENIQLEMFRPFYEAACGNGDCLYFNMLISFRNMVTAEAIKAILRKLSCIEAVDSISPITPDWAMALLNGGTFNAALPAAIAP